MVTFHSLFYTPIYATMAGGFLQSEGLDASFQTCPPEYSHGVSALNQGVVDVVQSGVMRGIIALDWGAESVPPHVAKINSRDGFFLLRRPSQQPFEWSHLSGASLIPISFSPMPWASLQFALKNNGVDPSSLALTPALPLDQAIAAFRRGDADFIHLPEPAASELVNSGAAHLAAALGPVNGHIAYSSFATTHRLLEQRPDAIRAFVRGFGRGLQWLASNNATTVADAVAPFFSDIPRDLLVQAIGRYQQQGTWSPDPALREPEYQRQQDILISAGLVKERQPYEKVVRPDFT